MIMPYKRIYGMGRNCKEGQVTIGHTMSDNQVRKFHYIDAMPGAGKTEFFVDQATKMLHEGPTENGSQILAYVAPTVDLLAETYRRVAAKVRSQKIMESKVYVIAGMEGRTKAFGRMDYREIEDQPTNALNFLFGLISEEDYKLVRYHKGNLHSLRETLQPGDVVMTTHESFVRVNRHDKTDGKFRLLRQTAVVFDEARQCVLKPYPYSMERDQWRQVFQCMEVVTEAEGDKKDHINVFKVTGVLPLAETKAKCGVTRLTDLPDAVKALRRKFKVEVEDGRGSLYIITTATIAETFDVRPSKNRIFVQIVMRPSSLFINYRTVVLTSAFFTDSQMFHFLKADGHTLVSLLDQKVLSPALVSIKTRSEQLRKSAAKRLHVATLLTPSRAGFYREVLTSSLLDSGMVIPRSLAIATSGLIRKDLGVDEVISHLAAKRMTVSVTNQQELDRKLRRYAVPPLWTLIIASMLIFREWSKKYSRPGSNPYSLLNINVNPRRDWVNRVRYVHVVRTIMANGGLSTESKTGSGEYNADHARDVNLVSPEWEQKLKSALFRGDEDAAFTLTSSTQLHGINTYSKMNAFTHLAALNPSPLQVRIYNVLLPEYDVDQDHSIENLVQTLYRTSLRDPAAKDPVLMIVPFTSSARLLADKIGVRAFKTVNDPAYTALIHFKSRSDENEASRIQKVKAASQKYDPKYLPQLTILRSRVKSARARLKGDPDSVRTLQTLTTNQKALSDLQAKASRSLQAKLKR